MKNASSLPSGNAYLIVLLTTSVTIKPKGIAVSTSILIFSIFSFNSISLSPKLNKTVVISVK